MRLRPLALLLCLSGVASDEPLGWQAEGAEKKGELVRAWTLYNQAAVFEPGNRKWAGKALALRTAALDQAKIVYGDPTEEVALDPAIVRPITGDEMVELQRLKAPPELKADTKRHRFDVRGPARTAWESVLRTCGLEPIFDSDYNVTTTVQLRLDDASCREAIRAIESLSTSFITPISERLVLVARETQEKRREQERNIAVSIPLPEPVTVQEAQELARAVQQTFEIQKFAIDSGRRMVLIRDRVSKVRPAQMLFEQLLLHRPQVIVDVDFLEVNNQRDSTFGVNLQNITQIVNFGSFMNNKPNILDTFTGFLTFGGGLTLFGIGITDSSLFATMTQSQSKVQLTAQIRGLDGQPATLHVGDRFPIMTQGYFGDTTPPPGGGSQVFRPPPTVQFEDLGLTIKITPRVHGEDEITLAVESQFKVLTSQQLNGIPVIANRSYNGQVRLKNGEWAICAGLISKTDIRGYTGIAGLSQIPVAGWGLRSNNITKNRGQMLLVLKPRIIHIGPTELATREIFVGTETKPLPPL